MVLRSTPLEMHVLSGRQLLLHFFSADVFANSTNDGFIVQFGVAFKGRCIIVASTSQSQPTLKSTRRWYDS